MCGIVGYVGDRQAPDFLLEGLSKLEYRGYDSAAITTALLQCAKKKGALPICMHW